jgi:hypothetical protein
MASFERRYTSATEVYFKNHWETGKANFKAMTHKPGDLPVDMHHFS